MAKVHAGFEQGVGRASESFRTGSGRVYGGFRRGVGGASELGKVRGQFALRCYWEP